MGNPFAEKPSPGPRGGDGRSGSAPSTRRSAGSVWACCAARVARPARVFRRRSPLAQQWVGGFLVNIKTASYSLG